MKRPDDIPTEPLCAQVLLTKNGYPAALSVVRDAYGVAMPAEEAGWFWIFATPKAAADIRRRGLRAVGTITQTLIPPQKGVAFDWPIDPESIPIVGTQAHTDLMLKEGSDAPRD